MQDNFPCATPHGEIREVFPNVFFVTGSVVMVPGMQLSRNMIILREGDALTLISPIRLDEDGLEALEKLGRIENIVKLGGYHLGMHNGLDDPFYMDRYRAKLWALDGMEHKGGLQTTHVLCTGGDMPVSNATLFVYESSNIPEATLLLNQNDGILISADSLQNWAVVDEYFSELAAQRMTQAGFIQPANIGPEWFRTCQPDLEEFDKVTQLSFVHLLPSHGSPILDTAKEDFKVTFTRLAR